MALPTIAGSAAVGQVFTASTGSWTGSPTSYAYAWQDCNSAGTSCVKVFSAAAPTYLIAPTDTGHTMRVVVTAFNSSGSRSARSTQTAVVTAPVAPPPPDTTPPTTPANFAATSMQQTSIATTWSASSDPDSPVAGYDLYLNGAKAGSTSTTIYSFAGLSCGTAYSLSVDAYDAAGNVSSSTVLSASTAACPVAPSNTAQPSISGTAQVGQTLTASAGSWSGSTPMTYAYQWQDCDSSGATCAAISGATSTTYTLAASDQGHTIRAKVTASNSAGSASSSSGQTGVVQAAPAPPAPTGLHVSGNLLLDASGNVVHLHGVNYSGTEYACIQGWGIFDGPSDAASITAIKSWNSNIVHIGLNEDCILGINGVSAAYSGSNYMNAIVGYVNSLHAQGLYAEVSLMWAAPGTQQALDHPPILDADHAAAALQAIANAFKNDPKTIIGLQSEPHAITWACWLNGGSSCSVGYTALGMQAALNAIRSTGASNIVTASGIDYANNLSQWLTYKPSDPLNQLIAEAHVYGGNSCSSTTCFNTDYAPVAAQVPMIWGETGETFDGSSCASTNISTFLPWADQHAIGYEAWTWDTWGNCSSLISDYNGTPANTYATYIKNHYATLP